MAALFEHDFLLEEEEHIATSEKMWKNHGAKMAAEEMKKWQQKIGENGSRKNEKMAAEERRKWRPQ